MRDDESPEIPEMRPARTAAIRDLLLDSLRTDPSVRARRTRRRVLLWSGVGAVVIGGGVTAGAILVGSAPVSNTELVHCLSSATQNADGTYPGSQATVATPSGQGRVHDALELCTQLWLQGVLDEDFDPSATSNRPGTVPSELQVCVMRDGSAAVVPGDAPTVCQRIGLAPLLE